MQAHNVPMKEFEAQLEEEKGSNFVLREKKIEPKEKLKEKDLGFSSCQEIAGLVNGALEGARKR